MRSRRVALPAGAGRGAKMAESSTHVVGPILEDGVFKAGLDGLRMQLGVDNLLDFPKRPNGTAVLMRQSFFEKIFTGKMEFLDFPTIDISAAQVDVKNLNLEQLLHIRCENREFHLASPGLKTQGDFLGAVDSTLEKRVSERLAAGGGVAWAEPSRMSDVVRVVFLLYGVYQELPAEVRSKSDLWLLRSGNLEALLCIKTCELRRLQTGDEASQEAAWCHRSLSRASAGIAKAKKQLHWELELCDRPSEFKEAVAAAAADDRKVRGARFEQRLASGGRAAGVPVNAIQAARQEELAAVRASADPKFQEAVEKAARLEAELEAAQNEVKRVSAEAKESEAKAVARTTAAEEQLQTQQAAAAEVTAAAVSNLEEQLKQQQLATAASAEEASQATARIAELEAKSKASEDAVNALEEKLKQQTAAVEAAEVASKDAAAATEAAVSKADSSAARVTELEGQLKDLQEAASTAEARLASVAELEEQLKEQKAIAESAEAKAQASAESAKAVEEQLAEQKAATQAAQAEAKVSADAAASAEAAAQASTASAAGLQEAADSAASLEVRLKEQTAALETAEADAKASADAARSAEATAEASTARLAELEEAMRAQQSAGTVSEASAASIAELEEQLKLQKLAVESAEAKAKASADSAASFEEQLKQNAAALETADAKAACAEEAALSASEQLTALAASGQQAQEEIRRLQAELSRSAQELSDLSSSVEEKANSPLREDGRKELVEAKSKEDEAKDDAGARDDVDAGRNAEPKDTGSKTFEPQSRSRVKLDKAEAKDQAPRFQCRVTEAKDIERPAAEDAPHQSGGLQVPEDDVAYHSANEGHDTEDDHRSRTGSSFSR